jgi:hypothetical protein
MFHGEDAADESWSVKREMMVTVDSVSDKKAEPCLLFALVYPFHIK